MPQRRWVQDVHAAGAVLRRMHRLTVLAGPAAPSSEASDHPQVPVEEQHLGGRAVDHQDAAPVPRRTRPT
jgi:hypothetical protein